MEKGILFNLYNNLSAYYLKAKHFQEAREVVKDMEKIDVKNSFFNFRKAQVIAADAESTLEELIEAE